MVNNTEKSLESVKKQRNKVLERLDTSQLEVEDLDKSKIQPESEDLEPSEFTENKPDSAYGAETKGSAEVDKSTRSERFSKDLTSQIPEETKDVGKKVRGKTDLAKTDAI
jgi:hypothetical protein